MSAVQDMIADLAVVPQLLVAQTKAGVPHDECLGAIFRPRAKKLTDTRCLKEDDKVTLTNAVQSAPFTGEQTTELATIVMGGVHAWNAHSRSLHSTATQQADRFENLIPAETWTKRRGDGPPVMKLSLIAATAWGLNIVWPSQRLLYRMTAILAWCTGNYEMTQDDVTSTMANIQKAIKARGTTRAVPLPYVANRVHAPRGAAHRSVRRTW